LGGPVTNEISTMNSQSDKEGQRPITAATVGSVLILLAMLVGGFLLILNTIAKKDTVVIVPMPESQVISTSIAVPPQVTATQNIPLTITAISVEEHPSFTLYWDRALWNKAIHRNSVNIEDFEKEEADYGELKFPYLTGNGFLLTGQSAAQILRDSTLLDDGNQIHFRDWENGLTFIFPNGNSVSAFGFDYRTSEIWQLTFDHSVITIPEGRKGFVGIIMQKDFLKEFSLRGPETAQGGISMDNISYISANAP
jgi:hypothetical protein